MYSVLADLVLLIHLAFVVFALFGGLLVLRSRGWLFLHLPAFVWAVVVEVRGIVCPLTPLENLFRRLAFQEGYASGFVEYYLLPLLYPEGLSRDMQLLLALVVVSVNLIVYLSVFVRLLPKELRERLATPPNLFSLIRLALAPMLVLIALAGWQQIFIWVLAVTLLTDTVDGWLARRLQLKSELGAKLDSWGDLAVFSVTPLGVWFLWPSIIQQELVWLVLAGLSLVLPLGVGLVRFGRITSYHTSGAKFAAVLLATATLALLLDLAAWPFRMAVLVLMAAECEEIVISLVLPRWQADVPTLAHALRLRQSMGGGKEEG